METDKRTLVGIHVLLHDIGNISCLIRNWSTTRVVLLLLCVARMGRKPKANSAHQDLFALSAISANWKLGNVPVA